MKDTNINVEIKAEFQPNSLATHQARYHIFTAETRKEKYLVDEFTAKCSKMT